MGGGFSVLVGLLNPSSPAAFIALLCILAFFIEAGNGAVYALLPHVNPHINGFMVRSVVTLSRSSSLTACAVQGGVVGGSGNLGGIVYTTVARYSSFAKTTWTIGVARYAGNPVALVRTVLTLISHSSAAVGVAIALVNPVVPQNRRTMYS